MNVNKKNFFGKALLEMKKVGDVVSKSASEIGDTIGEATSNAKNLAKISMMKAERDNLYMELGKAVFENGVTFDNEVAMNCIAEITKKNEEIAALEKETKTNKEANMSNASEDVPTSNEEDISSNVDETEGTEDNNI